MKTQNKVSMLMISVAGILILIFFGYQYIRVNEEQLFMKEKQKGDEQVIDKVLEFKSEGFLKPTKDNAAWDDMFAFTINKDTLWGNENLQSILTTFEMSSMSVYDKSGNELMSRSDSGGADFHLTNFQIKQLFKKGKTCHSFINEKGKIYEIFGATIVPTIDVYRTTPARGYLISLKEWDDNYISEMQKASGFDLMLVSNSSEKLNNENEIEKIFRNLKDYNNKDIAVLEFSRKNYLAAELSNNGLFAIIGIGSLIILIIVLFLLTKKWITVPLKYINDSLFIENTNSLKKLLNKQNEFGEIARLISRFNQQKDHLVIEINERLIVEKALIESKNFAEMIYKVSPSAIFSVDSNKIVTSWNAKAEKITGYSADEMIGNSCLIFTDSNSETGCGFYDNDILKPINEKECVIINKTGDKIFISKNVDILRDQNGNIIGGIESFEDITTRKAVENDLKKAKEEAEKTAIMKSDFLAMMSHEIRTPVNGVIGMTELALTTRLSRTQREYLKGVQTSAYTLLETINSILDFSKIEAGMLEIENTDFNIREVVERSVDILNVQAFVKNIELLYEVEPYLPDFFMGDAVRIRQILINLISNALKFTNKGEIHITVKSKTGQMDGNNNTIVQFIVEDTGIGIPEEKITHIFTAFAQADVSTTRNYGGSGLGLTISKKLTELMNGTISVESEVNKGSTFTFEVPLKASTNQLANNFREHLNIKQVLLVDDNSSNLKIMHDMLNYWGINSSMASNGEMAIDLIKQSKENNTLFDFVVLDMHMPEMDGLTVARKIKHELDLPCEPVILMLSSVEKENIKELGDKAGIDNYLLKPVKMKDFYDLLLNANDIKSKSKKEENHRNVVMDEMNDILKGNTILITDDNKINIELLKALLVKTGADVYTACNGAEAVEMYKQKNPDMVFMDVNMPVMNGFEATKLIRFLDSDKKRTPVIALTAVAMQGDREKCIDMGMDGYLSKPFIPKDFYDVIRKYLSKIQQNSTTDKVPVDAEIENKIYDKEEFISLMGIDQELYVDIISDFKRLFPEYYQKMKESIDVADLEQVDFFAHAIKGMCGNIRAMSLSKIAWRIETLSKTPEMLNEMQTCSVQLKNAYNELLPFLD
jgi:PAS domain S-box-containing protein